jgi:hypothetical protein
MPRRVLMSCLAGALLCAQAHAQPAPTADPAEAPEAVPDGSSDAATETGGEVKPPMTPTVDQVTDRKSDSQLDMVEPPKLVDEGDFPVRRRSYVYPAAEILFGEISLGLSLRALGVPWAQTTRETIKNNLDPSTWHFDSDSYTINNGGHPFGGAMYFSAARSTGHNFWVSSLYAFGGSAFWELFMENERPSLNDQITTPFGGVFIGEMMHRASRALLYPGYGKPGWMRKGVAWVIDPVGSVNRATWGDPWAKTAPPSLYAHVGVGTQLSSRVLGQNGSGAQFHTNLYVEHGLTGDRAFQPTHPLDHFELRSSVDATPKDIDLALNVRGMLLGQGGWSPRLRGMYGLFGAYDFDNQEQVRASMLGVGPGATGEVQVGRYGFIESTVAAYAVPWGAAGGISEREKLGRDHHRGPGLAQLFELKAGRRGIASLRSTTRAYEIAARYAGDDTNEIVVRTTLAAEVHVATHHAIGVEGTYGWRRASQTDGFMTTVATENSAEARLFYAITMDEILGR